MQWLLLAEKYSITEMYCKIGRLELFSDFEVKVNKRKNVLIIVHRLKDYSDWHFRFFKLKNHYLQFIIKHEALDYSGLMKVCGISDESTLPFSILLSFEA